MALVKKARHKVIWQRLEMVYVATGRIDAYVTPRLSPWDFGGGQIIVEEVGGKVTTFSERHFHHREEQCVSCKTRSV